jgi:hypothetical protein
MSFERTHKSSNTALRAVRSYRLIQNDRRAVRVGDEVAGTARAKEDAMSWKALVVAIVTLGSCPSLIAQDKQSEPFLGIWEINLTRTVNYPQQSQMIINVPARGGGFISTRATIAKENKSSSSEIHPVAFDGKPHATTGGDAREITYKLIDPYTIERTHNRNGRITVDTEQVSKDGKTLTVTQPGGVTRIYDKKFSVKAD